MSILLDVFFCFVPSSQQPESIKVNSHHPLFSCRAFQTHHLHAYMSFNFSPWNRQKKLFDVDWPWIMKYVSCFLALQCLRPYVYNAKNGKKKHEREEQTTRQVFSYHPSLSCLFNFCITFALHNSEFLLVLTLSHYSPSWLRDPMAVNYTISSLWPVIAVTISGMVYF